jgi:beta-glucosidase
VKTPTVKTHALKTHALKTHALKTLLRPLCAGALALASLASGCTPRPELPAAAWQDPDLGKGFNRNGKPPFLFGAATASHQVEGGPKSGGLVNDWSQWEEQRPEMVHAADKSANGPDSWENFSTDVQLLRRLGANGYRLSVEWSRLQPARGAPLDAAAVARYRAWMQQLRAAGIEPMVTLHHFTLPRWVMSEFNGWEDETGRTRAAFTAFSEQVAAALGAEVDLWVTINEPNVYAVNSYINGIWPPGKRDNTIAARVLANLLEAHAASAAAIKRGDTRDANGDGAAARVGFAHHMRIFQAATGSTLDGTIASLTDDFINESVLEANRTGVIRIDVPPSVSIRRPVEGLKGSYDFVGLNYYTRDFVRADLSDPALSLQFVPMGRPRNDLGWDLYPEGLYESLMRISKEKLPDGTPMPIYVTENGMADADGMERPEVLRQHLAYMQKAIDDGADVRGYMHWTLMDNFEWAEGYDTRSRFGLFRTDFASPERTRTPTPAVETFRQVARNLGLTPLDG